MNMSETMQFIKAVLRGKLSLDEAMSRHTSWRVGGKVERLYRPADLDDLRVFLCSLPADEPALAVGLGSNLLVRDAGISGTVLLLHGALGEMRLQDDGLIYVQAGVPGAKLARYAALHNLGGAEFFAGIPGTVGGMLAMNAGCYGSETWQHVTGVQVVTRDGNLLVRAPEEYEIGYRSVVKRETGKVKRNEDSVHHSLFTFQEQEFFVGAWFRFGHGDGEASRQKIKELLSRRIASQPLSLPNAGSVFRNPPGDYAARLIEQCGLKGRKIGGAQVSEKHANFIVNAGGATAADIEALIFKIRETVAGQTGVELHTEVKIIGDMQNMKKQSDPRSALLHPRSAVFDPAAFGKVAVLFGGRSAEREVSLKSGAAVLAALKRSGVDAHPFDPAVKSLQVLADEGFDRVFIALHGRFGEDGTVQGALELLGIPYTGSGVMASALGMDKWRSKLVWQSGGLPIPAFQMLNEGYASGEVIGQLGLPLFVKPANEGSSVGISKVKTAGELQAAYQTAAKHDSLVIAERFIGGGEYTVAILGEQALPVIKIEPANEFYDFEAKYLRDDTRYLCPSGLAPDVEAEMQRLAKMAFALIGGQGWGRIDFLMDEAGNPYVLEANTSPGMTDHSLVPMAARTAGIGFDELVLRILELAHVG